MKVLVLNSGSSSIKFQLFEMDKNESVASGIIEQIGDESASSAKIEFGSDKIKKKAPIKDHTVGLGIMNELLIESKMLTNMEEVSAIGHRVVHGGEKFSAPVVVNDEVLAAIEELIPLAPLHNPANLEGIKIMQSIVPNTPQVVVFDTAFHATIPQHAYMYALPYENYEKDGVRRYGFHGTSHNFVSKEAAKYLGKDAKELNAITLHLGNGASMAAIKNGESIDTTMGLTPLEGLMMGTRSGDLDPAILFYLARKNNMSIDDLDNLLNKKSGVQGICGSSDMRDVEDGIKAGDKKAQLALDMYGYRIRKYIGAYSAIIGKLDCIIFTGGIGENDSGARVKCCEGLDNLGIKLDLEKNNQRAKDILDLGLADSNVKVLVIPTNEELEIAQQAKSLLGK